MDSPNISRRSLLQISAATAVAGVASSLQTRLDAADSDSGLKGRVRHSVCKWCYPKVSLDELCLAAKSIGLSSIELLNPEDFGTIQKHQLDCAMVSFPKASLNGVVVGGIQKAWNRVEHHEVLLEAYERCIKATAEAGFKNLICFSGNRDGLDDQKGLENCALGLQKILPLAEKHRVTLVMELLNSRVDHADYMCDKSAWGVELVKRIGSDHFKLLYDIYHMQIMEGDVIATIKAHHACFAHYHTGGVPGRHEIDETQELNYGAIMRAIVATGYKGYVGQEFIPAKPDAMASLKQAVLTCDV
jgi:hydroxypyruvate isomerase